jgi:hypothetical protein
MRQFVGRAWLIARITAEWEAVRADGEGRLITVRGRRRVGKTWLVEEFIERASPPHIFFAASAQTEERELGLFARELASSSLPSHRLAEGAEFSTWQAALVTAASETDQVRPSVIVLDEFPYLLGETEQSRKAALGTVQTAWDRTLSKQPVLLILVGSDFAMMEQITSHGRPLYQRTSREIFVPPLDPAEAAALSGLSGGDALDSYLVTGGFPKVVRAKMGRSLKDFLEDQLADDGSPLIATGRQVLDGEFAPNTQARAILSVIGEGFRRRTDIASEIGVEAHNLQGPLNTLVDKKRVVESRRPLSTGASRDARYEIVDPYLRFFMRFVDRYRGEIERGRGRVVAKAILADWPAYRGKAIEALIREAVDEILPDSRFGPAVAVGGFWTTDHQIEIDLVGADRREPPAKRIDFIGSIKWRENKPLGFADLNGLTQKGASIRGVGSATKTVGVTRSGVDARAAAAFDVILEPDEILAAWTQH